MGSGGPISSLKTRRHLAVTVRRLVAKLALTIVAASAHANVGSILYIVPSDRQTEIAQIQEQLVSGLRVRGFSEAELRAIRFQVVSQTPADVSTFSRSLTSDRSRVLVLPTYYLLNHLIRTDQRPPIVFRAHASALLDLIPELRDPGRARATGVITEARGEAKMLELLKLARPDLRVACALASALDLGGNFSANLRAVGASLGLQVVPIAIASLDELKTHAAIRAFEGCEGFAIFLHDALINNPREYIAIINATGKPGVYAETKFGYSGALITVDADVAALHQHMFDQIAAVYRGVPLRNLPVAGPDRYEIGINPAAARSLAKPLDKRILLRASFFFAPQ